VYFHQAFAFKSGPKALRNARRTLDIEQKKLHVPLVDRTPQEPPPFIVAVVGPPGVGKTTLIRSLVKHYTKQNINDPRGPVTLVSGKQRRLTIFECPNDLNAMTDIGKIADLVLLMLDASFGFEMVRLLFFLLIAFSCYFFVSYFFFVSPLAVFLLSHSFLSFPSSFLPLSFFP
jgi:ribosome biogenesis protein BMS1